MNEYAHLSRATALSPLLIIGSFCTPFVSSAQTGSVPSGAFIVKPAKVELVVAPGEKGIDTDADE